MPALVDPTPVVRVSFLAAMQEFREEGRGGPDDDTLRGLDLREQAPAWDDEAGFAAYVDAVRAEADTPRRPGWVTCTSLWYVEGTEYLGALAIRHRLTEHLREYGGHIGYDVRPSARRRGHATAMFREGLRVAHRLGIDPALLTCDHDNVGSRTIIERAGGVLADRRGVKLRYWVPTINAAGTATAATTASPPPGPRPPI